MLVLESSAGPDDLSRRAPRRRAFRLTGLLSAALLAIGVLSATTAAPSAVADPPASPVVGAYSGEVLLAPNVDNVRRVDIPATISALVAANVNNFNYLVYGYGVANAATGSTARDTAAPKVTQAQWNDLPAFLTAAAAAGIEVWVYLVPPSEAGIGYTTPNYAPFQWDYVMWADEIGKVAAVHTNLRGIAIDDFGGNTAEAGSPWTFKFTTTNVAAMRAAARSHANWIGIYPAMYYCQFHGNGNISNAYRSIVDGFIGVYNGSPSCTWWSGDGTPVPNTTDSTQADLLLRVPSSLVRCQANGCLQLGIPGATGTVAGDYSLAKQTITVTAGSTKTLKFWTNDDWIGGSPGGYHKMQVLVDGVVVWQEDVATWQGWHQTTVNLATALAGKTSAVLTLRLYEAAGVGNFHVSAWFDELQATGFTINNGSFATSMSGWTPIESNGVFEQIWVPTKVFIPMAYAALLGGLETTPTSAGYTVAVVNKALQLTTEGKADGVILYNMNLTGAPNGLGDPGTPAAVAPLFAPY